jgi:hypothetical protein
MVSSAELALGNPFILPRQLLHVPDPPHVDVASIPMKPASYAAAADSPPAHLAACEAQMLGRTGCWPRGQGPSGSRSGKRRRSSQWMT